MPQADALSCNSDFECSYICIADRKDANGDLSSGAGGDGCECLVRNGGQELCDGFDDDCDGQIDEGVQNACGGCGPLQEEPGLGCGAQECPGVWTCTDDRSAVVCQSEGEDGTVNECGGCGPLDNSVGEPCGDCGQWRCDGDDALVCVEAPTLFFRDSDGDNHGDADDAREFCQPQGEYTARVDGDCDDANPNVHPESAEACNGIDDNCNGDADEGVLNACGGCGALQGSPGDDCGQDSCQGQWVCIANNSAVSCEGDNNNGCGGCEPLQGRVGEPCGACGTWACDGDNAVVCTEAQTEYFKDSDDDGFGVDGDSRLACGPQENYRATRGGDCNDNDSRIKPGADELCNGFDDNCNGVGDASDSDVLLERCDDVVGAAAVGCDLAGQCVYGCQDGQVDVNGDLDQPFGDGCECQISREVCDGVDNDCDGQIDEEGVLAACDNTLGLCQGAMSPTCDPQCSDDIYATHIQSSNNTFEADVEATCDGFDNNCDGQTDENCCADGDQDLIRLGGLIRNNITQTQPQMFFNNNEGDMTVVWGEFFRGELGLSVGDVYITKIDRHGDVLLAQQRFPSIEQQRQPLLDVAEDGTFMVAYLGPQNGFFATFFAQGAQWNTIPNPVPSDFTLIDQWDAVYRANTAIVWFTQNTLETHNEVFMGALSEQGPSTLTGPKLDGAFYRHPKMVRASNDHLLCGVQASDGFLNIGGGYTLELYTQDANDLNSGLTNLGEPIEGVFEGQYALASLEGDRPNMVAYVHVGDTQHHLIARAYTLDGSDHIQINVDTTDTSNTIHNLRLTTVDSLYLLTWSVNGNQPTLKAAWFDTSGALIEGPSIIQDDFSIRGGYQLVRSPPRAHGAPSWYSLVQSGKETSAVDNTSPRAYLRHFDPSFGQKLCFGAP